jgi:hypothetical protein
MLQKILTHHEHTGEERREKEGGGKVVRTFIF